MATEKRGDEVCVRKAIFAVIDVVDYVDISLKLVPNHSLICRHYPYPLELAFTSPDNVTEAI